MLSLQNTLESEKYACCPLPPYLEGSGCALEEDDSANRPLRDVCFHLLKLYSDRYVTFWGRVCGVSNLLLQGTIWPLLSLRA